MAKARPSDDDALCLIAMRRDRAKEVLNEILHGFIFFPLKGVRPAQMLDYLTNMLQALEMTLKLLSGDWRSHDVGKMFETVVSQPHPNPPLMKSIESALKDQKYLLSPLVGIMDNIPEIEDMYEYLNEKLKIKYRGFNWTIDQDLPDNFVQFLIEKASLFYRRGSFRVCPIRGTFGCQAA